MNLKLVESRVMVISPCVSLGSLKKGRSSRRIGCELKRSREVGADLNGGPTYRKLTGPHPPLSRLIDNLLDIIPPPRLIDYSLDIIPPLRHIYTTYWTSGFLCPLHLDASTAYSVHSVASSLQLSANSNKLSLLPAASPFSSEFNDLQETFEQLLLSQ